jgi:hypothetical protein
MEESAEFLDNKVNEPSVMDHNLDSHTDGSESELEDENSNHSSEDSDSLWIDTEEMFGEYDSNESYGD